MDFEIAMKKIVTWGKNGYVNSDQKEKNKIKQFKHFGVLYSKEALHCASTCMTNAGNKGNQDI